MCSIEELIARGAADYATLQQYTIAQRERFALETHSMVLYVGDEVSSLRRMEEESALRAIPAGYEIEELNGINVGCGDRTIHPALCQVDAHRGTFSVDVQTFSSASHIMAFASNLPFREESMDYIVALHLLEHEDDPVTVVRHWLKTIKPGGGIGIVLPDYRYTWDSRHDDHVWGHRWCPTPEVVREMYDKYWAKECVLERLQSYSFKLSFDVVFRKHGEFRPFRADDMRTKPTGKQLAESHGNLLYPPPRAM